MPAWKQTLYVLWILQFLTQVTTTLGLTFVPFFLEQDPVLNVTDPAQKVYYTSLILAAPFFTTLLATPLWGWFADRTGHKKQVVRAAMGLGITQLLLGIAQSPEQLIVIRMLQGVISGVVAANLALLSSMVPEDRQGWAISSLQSSIPAGLIFGPVIGGLLASSMGYRPVYWLFGGILVLCGVMVWLLIQEQSSEQPVTSQPAKPTTLQTPPSVPKNAVTEQTIPSSTQGDGTAEQKAPSSIESNATPEGTTSAVNVVQVKASNPFRDLGQALYKTWIQPELRIAFVILMLGQLALTNTQVMFAIYAGKWIDLWVRQHHVAPAWWNEGLMFASICITTTGLFHFAMSGWWGKWYDEKRKHLIPIGSVVSGLSTLLLAFWPPLWFVLLARLGMGAGMGPTSNLPFAQISAKVPAQERGKYMGLATASTHVGKMAGLLMGGVIGAWWGESINFALTAGLFFVMAWFSLRIESFSQH